MSEPKLKWDRLVKDGKPVPGVIVSDAGFYKICRVDIADDPAYRPSRNGEFLTINFFKTVKEAKQVCENHYAITGGRDD